MVGVLSLRSEEILEEAVCLVGGPLLQQFGDVGVGVGQEGEDMRLEEVEVKFVERLHRKGHNSASRHFKLIISNDCLSDCLSLLSLYLQTMSDPRKNQILQEFRRPTGNRPSKSRDIKNRLHHIRAKDTFLTDTQTSDYTKSSGEINVSRIQHLQVTVRKLEKDNAELRQKVVTLKASQCFEINEEKLKNVIRETDILRNQLETTKMELDQSLVERDFLERFNKNLKGQCQALTKELLQLKNSSPTEPLKSQRNIYTSRGEEIDATRSRNSISSNEMTKSVSKGKRKQLFLQWRKDKEERSNQNTLKSSLSSSQLQEDYYGRRSSKAKGFKHY